MTNSRIVPTKSLSLADQPWFSRIKRPSRYLGGEIHSVHKSSSSVEVTFALAFPDVYEVGMSHLGLKILYHVLNEIPWVWAQRVFAPWGDLEEELRRRNIPLWCLESGMPLREFDIVGFSLQHELCYTNVVNMLDLGKIPIWARDRRKPFPLIIAGGPACFNPEPVAEFFDVMVIGEAEEVVVDLVKLIRNAKGSKELNKEELLIELSKLPGLYVPAFFRPQYDKKGTLKDIKPLKPGYHKVQKVVIGDINRAPVPNPQIVPYTELIHDRLSVEITRGCGRGCRFCQAGMIYRPVREKRAEAIVQETEAGLRSTGYEDISLLSLSSGDYSAIGPLIKTLMDRLAELNTALSLPSLRIDSLGPQIIDEIKRVRKTGFTLAVEAGSERLRRVINKGLSEAEILQTAKEVFEAGWRLIKLYFMIGLPYETEADVEAIVEFSRRIGIIASRYGKKTGINVSVATFVPKAHTPFMWAHQLSMEEARARIKKIREKLMGTRVRVKWNQPELSWLEGIFSRGDRRLATAVVKAWKRGARFDAWSECFDLDLWRRVFRETEIDSANYLRARDLNEILPWEHIHSGVSIEFLRKEWERAAQEDFTPDCRDRCTLCGVCDHESIKPLVFPIKELEDHHVESIEEERIKFSIAFTKLGRLRHLSHLELTRALIRAFRRSGLPLAYSKGFHPKPKVSFASALPVGMESLEELLHVEVTRPIDPVYYKRLINQQLPEGIKVIEMSRIPLTQPLPRVKESSYEVTFGPNDHLDPSLVREFLAKEHLYFTKKNKKGERRIDIKGLVRDIKVAAPGKLLITLRHDLGIQLRPADVVAAIFGMNEDEKYAITIRKIGQVFHPSGR